MITLFNLLKEGLNPTKVDIIDYDGKLITQLEEGKLKYSHNIAQIPVAFWFALGTNRVLVRLYCFRQEHPKTELLSIKENPCTWRDLVKEKVYKHQWERRQYAYESY